jgi:hypothetical protein
MVLIFPRSIEDKEYKIELKEYFKFSSDYEGCTPEFIKAFSNKDFSTLLPLDASAKMTTNPINIDAITGLDDPVVLVTIKSDTSKLNWVYLLANKIKFDTDFLKPSFTL